MEELMDLSLRQDIGFLLSRAGGLAARRANAALAEHGLRIRQYSVLSLAADAAGGLSQRELATALGLDPSQVVLLVDELADGGLVERRPSPVDRRARLVVATAAGRAVRRRAGKRIRREVARQLEPLTPEEQAALRDILAKLVDDESPAGARSAV